MPIIFPKAAEVRTAQRSRTSSRTGAALAPLHLWHLTSLDAPTVALAWASSFAWSTGLHLPLEVAAVIVLCVWTVYVGDRLLDARAALRSGAEDRLRERHYFHWRHRRVLIPLAVVAGTAAAILVLGCIPVIARERDSVLAAASLAYFARVHQSQLSPVRRARPFFSPLVTKELIVGVLFAAGCALPALGTAWAAPLATRWAFAGAIAFYAALAWLNCHAIEQWESEAARLGVSVTRIALGLASLGLGGSLLFCRAHPRPALLLAAAALSALLLALLDRLRVRLAPMTLRAAADLVLLTPAIAIPIAWLLR